MMSSRFRFLDYSYRFEMDLKNFMPGYEYFDGNLSDDLTLVQFHSNAPIGSGRTLKWWTSLEQANKFSTEEDLLQSLALLPEWGERNYVTLIRIPKGTDVAFYKGFAKFQFSRGTQEIYFGGGIQYRFKYFDKNWIIKTKLIR